MDTDKAGQLIEQLSSNVSGLKKALEPLVSGDLNVTANKLPVLDRAKLYIFVTYTIESILFSNLGLQGIDASSHPVMTELTRVRQYFEKIKAAEQGDQKPTMKLDRAAAGRIVKHNLAANSNMGKKRRFSQDEASSTKPSPQLQCPADTDGEKATEEMIRKGKKGKKAISGRKAARSQADEP